MVSKKIDMTQGSITKNTILFALPICIGSILQLLYNTVDTIVVGNFCGATSIAAVGTSSQPVEIIVYLFLGVGHGISILVSQAVGRKNHDEVKILTTTSTFFLFITAIPLTVIGYFVGPLILKAMMVPEDTMFLATKYLQIVFLGTIGLMGYNFNAGILRGLGDSNSSVLFLVFSCIINIILDLLFVVLFKMGVSGVAIATSVATFSSWVFSIIYIKKNYKELDFPIFSTRFDKKILVKILKTGIPLGFNNCLYSFGHTMMQALINTQGSIFMASCSVAGKLTGMSNIVLNSISASLLTFTGQNFGAKKYKRLKRGCIQLPIMAGTITLIMGIIISIFARQIIWIFTKDENVIEMSIFYIRIVMPFTWCFAVFNTITNVVNGLGLVKYTTIVNILMLWAVRIPTAYLIKTLINGKYLMAAVPISFAFGMLCMITFYRSKKWKEIATHKEE